MRTRTLTVMFTDIVGSTELLSRLGPRDGDRLLSAHFELLNELVERRHGRAVKTLGDGLMAVFDAAGDAIECAVAIQQACVRSVPRAAGEPVCLRIGLSSGDVAIEDGDCFGTAVVEASRVCGLAAGRQILFAESTRLLARDHTPIAAVGELKLKGLGEPCMVWEAPWSPDDPIRVRAVLADDAVLMREGIAHVLEAAGIEVVGQVGDGTELLRVTAETQPDVAIVDVRMPPTHSDEGLRAAEAVLAAHRRTGVLVLSQDVQPRHQARLLAARATGVGYLHKDRVANVREFAEATRRVAAGGHAFENAPVGGEAWPR